MNEATKDQDLALIRLYLEGETTEEQTAYIEKQIQENKAFKEKMEAYRIKFVAKKEIDALLFFASPSRPSWWVGKMVLAVLLLGVFVGSYFVYSALFDTAKTAEKKEAFPSSTASKVEKKEKIKGKIQDTTAQKEASKSDAEEKKQDISNKYVLTCLENRRIEVLAFYQDFDSLAIAKNIAINNLDEFERKQVLKNLAYIQANPYILSKLTSTTTGKALEQSIQFDALLDSINHQYYGKNMERGRDNSSSNPTIDQSIQALQQNCNELSLVINRLREQKKRYWQSINRKIKNAK